MHADAKLPRFREEDFHLRSARGPDRGRIAWRTGPSQYADLEPHYAAVERSFGVAGEDGANPFAAWRSGAVPDAAGRRHADGGGVLGRRRARRAGTPTGRPTGANSVPYDGRPACVDCGFCGGYGCPVHAKGDPIAALQRALRSGRCELRPESYVTEILLDARGRRAPPASATST